MGQKVKLPAPAAAFVNGTAIHSIELDDGRIGSAVHPGASSVAASLAIGEREHKNGKQVLLATLIGYETTLRISMAMFPHHRRMGLHPTGTTGTFGAALTAGKLLGLSAGQMVNALGVAGTFASGLREGKGDELMMKRIHGGKAAQAGITAAMLAKNGFRAPAAIFEGSNGFFKLFTKEYDIKKITDGLGESFVTDQCYYKPYSCCRHFHAPIDSLLGLMKKHDLKPDQIEHIHVRIYREGTYYAGNYPQNILDSQFSMPFTLAAVLYDKQALLEQFTEEKINDPRFKALAAKVAIDFDAELDEDYVKNKKMAHVLEIRLKNGTVLTNRVDYPKGSENNPFTDDEVIAKFKSLAGVAIPKDRVERLISMWRGIEELKDVNELSVFLNS
jgi:2-methylcitrate dehydratase PrpD